MLVSINCLLFIKLLRLEMIRLLALLATLKQAERAQPKQDVVSHPYAVPVVRLIQSECYQFLQISTISWITIILPIIVSLLCGITLVI
jgi:hypothetical protein